MAHRHTLPVLPLRGTVIFPGLTAPIAAGRPGTLRAIEAALKADRLVFAVAQRDNTDEPAPEILYAMGVVARIGQIQRGLGGVQLLLNGEQRATALQYTTNDGYLNAVVVDVEEMKPVDDEDPAFVALYKEIRERAAELGERRGLPEEVVHQVLDSVTDPGRFADLVAGYIDLPTPEKQGLLEIAERRGAAAPRARARAEADRHARGAGRDQVAGPGGAGRAAARDVPARADEGDPEGAGRRRSPPRKSTALREKLSKLELPKEARAEVERELGRLERSGRESMEAQVIRTYLEWIAELPWNARSDDDLDLKNASTILDEDHYGLQDVKDRVLEFLAVRQLRAQQMAEEVRKTGEMPIVKLQATKEDATPSLGQGRPTSARSPTPGKPRRGPWPRVRSCCSWARRAWARRRSPSRSRARWGASTCARRWAARATRPTSAAIGAPTWAPCRAASSRG